jgi:hypothetical protein
MGLFDWLASKVREAFARGAVQGLADVGVLDINATPADVRKALEGKVAAVEDKKGAKAK